MLSEAKIKEKLQSALTLERYMHTLGVVEAAKKLAERWEEDVQKAALAALLHDCAKDYPESLKRQFCKEFHIPLDAAMKKHIDLTHPFLGAEVAKREYGVEDEDVLNAIRYHTTGRRGMSRLEKIIYIADYIEAGRKPFPGLEDARKLAFEDLNKAMELVLSNTLAYVKERGRALHPLTTEAMKDYSNSI